MTESIDEAIMRVVRENVTVRIKEGNNNYYSSRDKTITVQLFMGDSEVPFASDSFSFTEGEPSRDPY